MEFLGFAAVALVFVTGGLVATHLLDRSNRNAGCDHGGGYPASVDTPVD